ncbi:MAG: superfamily [Bacteroidetes bacterium]|jgi:putative hydrolase of the HAD superfamily|nr:superfamily [Bacteroidota bacterium]
MTLYKHIFFDLDHTLWDMNSNSYVTICELAMKYKLAERGITSIDDFFCKYKVINDQLWLDYSRDLIDRNVLRSERFKRAFSLFGIIDDQLAEEFGDDYVSHAPKKSNLMPHSIDVLDYLSSKYQLHIITNGFEEVQHVKIENSNLKKYFSNVITSDKACFKKPHKGIFEYSINLTAAEYKNSIMIGDSLEADIIGARDCGMDQVFYNPEKISHEEKVTHEISCLTELKNIL